MHYRCVTVALPLHYLLGVKAASQQVACRRDDFSARRSLALRSRVGGKGGGQRRKRRLRRLRLLLRLLLLLRLPLLLLLLLLLMR